MSNQSKKNPKKPRPKPTKKQLKPDSLSKPTSSLSANLPKVKGTTLPNNKSKSLPLENQKTNNQKLVVDLANESPDVDYYTQRTTRSQSSLDSSIIREPKSVKSPIDTIKNKRVLSSPVKQTQSQSQPKKKANTKTSNTFSNHSNLLQKLQAEKMEAETKFLELKSAYDLLASDFEELKELTISKAERTFEEYKKISEKRFETSQKLTDNLKQDLKQARREKEELINEIKYETNLRIESETKLEQLKKTNTHAKATDEIQQKSSTKTQNKTIKLYQMLTGLKVVPHIIEERQNSHTNEAMYECIIKSKSGLLEFTLERELDADISMISYTPKEILGQISSQLPEYLKDQISFKEDQMPIFFSKLTSNMHGTH